MDVGLVLYWACGYALSVLLVISRYGISTTSSIGLSIVDSRAGIRSPSSIGDLFDAERYREKLGKPLMFSTLQRRRLKWSAA